MSTPIKSILVTDWSRHHIAGHDLDGGALISFDLDTTIVGTEALGRDVSLWQAGDIATLKFDPDSGEARLRIVTPKEYVVRVRDFQIIDIVHTPAPALGEARHIVMKGTAQNGAGYVMPMLGYTAWRSAWDMSSLEEALKKAQSVTDAATKISYGTRVDEVVAGSPHFRQHAGQYNKIFYPRVQEAGEETVFDKAEGLTVTTISVKQEGEKPRAQMFAAAFVKKTKDSAVPGTVEYLLPKKGTAFSQPYFVVDGARVFIRTGTAQEAV